MGPGDPECCQLFQLLCSWGGTCPSLWGHCAAVIGHPGVFLGWLVGFGRAGGGETHGRHLGSLQAASECGSGSSSCSPEWSSQLEFATNPAGKVLPASSRCPAASLGSSVGGQQWGTLQHLEQSIAEPTPPPPARPSRRCLEQRTKGALSFSPHCCCIDELPPGS